MSRRFGRKQKRAMRAEIEGLSYGLNLSEERRASLAKDLRRTTNLYAELVSRIEDWDADIRSMLGPFTSFAVNDQTFRVDHPDQIRQMPILPPVPIFSSHPSDMIGETVTYYVERILGLLTDLREDDLMTLRRYLRLRIECGSDRESSSYFAMSESYWENLMRNPEAMRRTIPMIVEQLLRQLAQPPKRNAADAMALAVQGASRRGS